MRYILLFALIGVIGYATIKEGFKNPDEYIVKIVDCDSRDECCVFLLENVSGKRIILLSDKSSGENINPFKNFIELSPDTTYRIDVYIDSNKYILPPSGKNTRLKYPYTIYLEDVLFIQNDTVKSQIYRSKKIWDKYLEK